MPKKPKTYDFEEIMSLTDEQKRQVIPQLASVANQRLRELEKQGETRWAYERVIKDLALPKGVTPRFSYSTTKLKRKAALDNYLSSILRFLNSESSTVTGIRAINKRRVEAFKEKGYTIKDEALFIDFLKSGIFTTLANVAASEFILEDIDLAMEQGYTLDEIMTGYQAFIDRDLSLQGMQAVRRSYRRSSKRRKDRRNKQ